MDSKNHTDRFFFDIDQLFYFQNKYMGTLLELK